MNIREAFSHRDVFGSVIRNPETFAAWLAFLSALFALPMSESEAEIFRSCTGRSTLPQTSFNEAWMVCGRRAGKSFMMALIAVFCAVFNDYTPYLAVGERATIMVIAADRKQARVIMRYVRGLLRLPIFAKLVARETAESFDLTNRVTIEIHTASVKTTRGYSIPVALCDEAAFWSNSPDAAVQDTEVLDSIRPAMAMFPNALLLGATSPYARSGVVWEAYRRYYGKDDAPGLVWQAATRIMNPTVPQRVIDAAMERDPASASAEYGAQFRVDVESFLSREIIYAAVVPGRYELPHVSGVRYHAFCDPSGGAQDDMVLAIAHREKEVAVLDCVRAVRPPFSPDQVCDEFAQTLKSYGLHTVRGDRYGGDWPAD